MLKRTPSSPWFVLATVLFLSIGAVGCGGGGNGDDDYNNNGNNGNNGGSAQRIYGQYAVSSLYSRPPSSGYVCVQNAFNIQYGYTLREAEDKALAVCNREIFDAPYLRCRSETAVDERYGNGIRRSKPSDPYDVPCLAYAEEVNNADRLCRFGVGKGRSLSEATNNALARCMSARHSCTIKISVCISPF